MPTLPGLPSTWPSYLHAGSVLQGTSLSLCLALSLMSLLHPSPSASLNMPFSPGLCHSLSLTGLSLPLSIFCFVFLCISCIGLWLWVTDCFSFSLSQSHCLRISASDYSVSGFFSLPSCPQASPEADDAWDARQGDSQQKPPPVPYQVPDERQQHHSPCPEGAA